MSAAPLDWVLTGPGAPTPAQPAGLPADAGWQHLRLDDTPTGCADWARALRRHAGTWRQGGLVLLLSDDVDLAAPAITELFRSMRQHQLAVAQPSLAWHSHFADAATLHNPSFQWRHVNRVDPSALAFRADLLAALLPALDENPDAAQWARLLPALMPDPLHGAAVVDSVQAVRRRAPDEAELAEPAWPARLDVDGPHREPGYSWGGLGLRGQAVSLFDERREEFLGLLTSGYACAVQEPMPIGEVFLQHFLRSLSPAPGPLTRPAAPPPTAPLPALRRSPIVAQRAD